MQCKKLAFAVAFLFAMPLPALANPSGASVVSGSAAVSSSGSSLTVTNSSARAGITICVIGYCDLDSPQPPIQIGPMPEPTPPIQIVPIQPIQISPLLPKLVLDLKAIAAHMAAPTTASGDFQTAAAAPESSPAASGLLTLNLEKRDLSF
jgi:hypothetical protein